MINWFSPKLLKGKNRNNYITHENNDEIDCVFCKKKKEKWIQKWTFKLQVQWYRAKEGKKDMVHKM